MTPSEIEDLPIFFEQFETGLAEFDLYLLKKIENGKQISSEKILKKLKSLNQNLAYNLDKDEVMEICKIVFKKFSDHEKLIRTKIYEIHRKQETNIAFEDPAEQDEDLKKKLAENAIKNAENEKKLDDFRAML